MSTKKMQGWSLGSCAAVLFVSSAFVQTGCEEQAPEAFCADWARASCESLSSCCQAETFDAYFCEAGLSAECLEGTAAEWVRAGLIAYDGGAARGCFAPVEGCGPITRTEEEVLACRRMLFGYRALGEACDSAIQCVRSEGEGAYSDCYFGVCVTVQPSPDACGFDPGALVMRECQAETFCEPKPASTEPPETQSEAVLGFEGTCVPKKTAGEKCVDEQEDYLPCATGLFCDYYGPDPVCQKLLPEGAPCGDHFMCESGQCEYDYPAGVCVGSGLYCYAPPVCGDGQCDEGESNGCPADCGACGNGYCEEDGIGSCYEDCLSCGDGYCEEGEYDWCYEDCEI